MMDGALIDSQRISESIIVDEILKKWRGAENYKRVLTFEALIGEREYQESLHKKTGQDPISISGELVLIFNYLQKAFNTYGETFGDPEEKPTMDVIRKITAIGLRALENYGCPLRDIEGSLAARPTEDISEANVPSNILTLSADKEINEAGFHEVD